MSHHRKDTVTLERLEAALALVSYAILEDGDVYAPYLNRLEREIAALRARDDVVARARRYLEAKATPKLQAPAT